MSDYIYSHKYIRWYISLIRKAKSRSSLNTYYEKHHVFPRCIFTHKSNKNIANLTAREHFIAHKLLAKIYILRYGQNHMYFRKLLHAFSFMLTRNDVKNNSRMYNECKNALSVSRKGVKFKISEETELERRKKISIAVKNRPPISDEIRKNMSIAQKGKLISIEHRRKIAEKIKKMLKDILLYMITEV